MQGLETVVVPFLTMQGWASIRRTGRRVDTVVPRSDGGFRVTVLELARPSVLAIVVRDVLLVPDDGRAAGRLHRLNHAFAGKLMIWGTEELVLALEHPTATLRTPDDFGEALETALEAVALIDRMLGDIGATAGAPDPSRSWLLAVSEAELVARERWNYLDDRGPASA